MIVWLLFFGLNLLASLIALLRERGEDPRFEGDKNVNIRDDLADYKRQIGYLPEEAHLYPFLSGLEYLELVGRLRGLPGRVIATRTVSLLELFAMYPHRHTTLVTYSKGSGTPCRRVTEDAIKRIGNR